jgi:uncharacterized protein (DUF58 family)
MVRPAPDTTGVYVDLETLIALEHKVRRVNFLPRQPVHSLLSGRYGSRLRGRGLNFEEIRDYLPGDDVRAIDWKVTARLQKPHVRVFNEERDRKALVVVDQRLSMFFGSRHAMKSVVAAEAAAIAAWRVLAVGDRLGGVVFNDTDLVEIKPQRSRRNVLRLLDVVVRQNAALGVSRRIQRSGAMLNRALAHAQRLVSHDATLIIISDFDGADEETRRVVGAMSRHVDVICALVHDPLQSELPPAGQMVVTNGELQIVLDAGHDKTRRDIVAMAEKRLLDLFQWTPDFGVPFLPLSTAEETAGQLSHLMGRLQPQNAAQRVGAGGGHG